MTRRESGAKGRLSAPDDAARAASGDLARRRKRCGALAEAAARQAGASPRRCPSFSRVPLRSRACPEARETRSDLATALSASARCAAASSQAWRGADARVAIHRASPPTRRVMAALHASCFRQALGRDSHGAIHRWSRHGLPLASSLDARGHSRRLPYRATRGDEAELLTLAVAPDCRRPGLAGRCWKPPLPCLREAGVEAAVSRGRGGKRSRRLAFTASLGAKAVGRRPRYYDTAPMPRSSVLPFRPDCRR